MAFFTEDFLNFFIELAPNNHKDWFDLNRKRYEESIKKPFYAFTQHVIDRIAQSDASFKDLLAKDCVFRINRDIRFSKDKSPYKLQYSAVIAPNGKKSKAVNGIYFEFGPEHLRVYGGIYEIEKEDLELMREGIANNLDEFQKIYNSKEFKSHFGKILGEKNKIIHYELLKRLLQIEGLKDFVLAPLKRIMEQFNKEKISQLVFNVDSELVVSGNPNSFPKKRKEMVIKLLTLRFNKLREIYSQYQ
jgi:uncharacterized protein (TIGR02453 family)